MIGRLDGMKFNAGRSQCFKSNISFLFIYDIRGNYIDLVDLNLFNIVLIKIFSVKNVAKHS